LTGIVMFPSHDRVRYGGAVSKYYSVAEHSVYVSEFVPRNCARLALMHDAAEAYVGDMIRPLKYDDSSQLGAEFEKAERRVQRAIWERFGLLALEDRLAEVKKIDDLIIVDESRQLIANPEEFVPEDVEGIPNFHYGIGMEWYKAKRLFLDRFEELFPEE